MAESHRPGNGMKSFSMHVSDAGSAPMFAALAKEQSDLPTFAFEPAATQVVDPETAARRYLGHALTSNSVPDFTAPSAENADSQFKVIGTETVPLTHTRTVKFRQAFHDIPVYGSLVTVELDDDNKLVSLNSALGEPTNVPPVAKISATRAASAVDKKGQFKKKIAGVAPRLSFYYEAKKDKWHLAYIFEDVEVTMPESAGSGPLRPRYFDYVVDANTGRVIAELPRTPTMAAEEQLAFDARNVQRTINVEKIGARAVLKDTVNNIQTFDFRFRDPNVNDALLPGDEIGPAWPPAAVSAHANAAAVAHFLREVVLRNNIDNRGGPMNASINCVVMRESPGGNQWFNAYWNGVQMVYGQVLNGNQLLTLAAALDIVGHEMFHGVTDNTSRLEYAAQSGALNESYSDIFGMLIANRGNPDPRQWDWRLGQGFARGGGPIRDMSDPASRGQPAHMNQYRIMPVTQNGDWGGVHVNSGIHNKAAYLMLVAEEGGSLVFTPDEVAAVFYVAVTQLLSRTSQFRDSRRAVVSAARTLFRTAPSAQLARRISAIDASFDGVGIA
ncbi:peptidase M4 family protein [Rhizobium anhuiense]|uniref:Neutral metalloproteinase n=5 Tax=Rhizobium TaxID=379 RepID=A0A432NW72_9HYPH|nr:peptidase M4 family protein [Rhizobium phaseoli]ARQ62100.1 peptidase M4 family protein [Rhizobium sp. Kim5]KKZ84524.1 metallopeptidase [Rhizobium phaseoli Ch24-10]PDS34583.1 peptidase M4 family protein [Rhizobium anhuiense]PDS81778.1 peptidase M4 family protein [Rhizobium sp. L18]PDT26548.1 peptidase M4 family protein [Rhizobium sp. L9]PDV85741.1 peptidase M4 family protein [Rhizobium sp. H4]RUM03655.1 peptidase M4 family protein [Rhizobium chutanense]